MLDEFTKEVSVSTEDKWWALEDLYVRSSGDEEERGKGTGRKCPVR